MAGSGRCSGGSGVGGPGALRGWIWTACGRFPGRRGAWSGCMRPGAAAGSAFGCRLTRTARDRPLRGFVVPGATPARRGLAGLRVDAAPRAETRSDETPAACRGPRRGTSLRCRGRSAGDSSPVTSDGVVGPGDARDRPHPVETVAPGEAYPGRCLTNDLPHPVWTFALPWVRPARYPHPHAPPQEPAALPPPPSAARRCRRCPDAGTESKGPRGRPQPPSRTVSGALRCAGSAPGARPLAGAVLCTACGFPVRLL